MRASLEMFTVAAARKGLLLPGQVEVLRPYLRVALMSVPRALTWMAGGQRPARRDRGAVAAAVRGGRRLDDGGPHLSDPQPRRCPRWAARRRVRRMAHAAAPRGWDAVRRRGRGARGQRVEPRAGRPGGGDEERRERGAPSPRGRPPGARGHARMCSGSTQC